MVRYFNPLKPACTDISGATFPHAANAPRTPRRNLDFAETDHVHQRFQGRAVTRRQRWELQLVPSRHLHFPIEARPASSTQLALQPRRQGKFSTQWRNQNYPRSSPPLLGGYVNHLALLAIGG